jgi:hypothetical protein
MVNRPIVMWRIAPGRRDTPSENRRRRQVTRGLVHPQDSRVGSSREIT